MPVRIVEGQLPYSGGRGIEIDADKVISLLLREENNLILVNDDNEIYTDLQLASGLTPSSDFPVGVTTGKVLQSDGRTQSGLLLNWKTTSGDYARWIYANDGKIYFDGGNGTRNQVYYSSEVDALLQQLRTYIDTNFQPKLTAGAGITIDQNNVISAQGAGLGDVSGPSSSVNGNLAVFDGTTGKAIKDGGPIPTGVPSGGSNGDVLTNVSGTPMWQAPTGTTYTAGAGINIDGNNEISNTIPGATVSASAPATPTEGMQWYDTTNDVLKVYNGSSWESIATGGAISDTAYGSSWDGETTTAPSQNAVYDKISSMDTTLGTAIQPGDNVSDLVNDAGYLTSAPVTSVNTQTGAVVLDADDISDSTTTNKWTNTTEKTTWNGKQDALVSGTNIKTINSNSILGSGDLVVSGLPAGGTTGQILIMTANGPARADPTDANIVMSDTNAPIIIRKLWGGTEGDYSAVQTYNENEAYLTIEGGPTPPSPGWQPGANTLAYIPFSGNYDDTQGNTVTQSGTAGTYATTQQGEQYMVTAGGPSSNNTLLTISNLNGISGDGNWTASCWVNPTDTGNLKVVRGYGMSSSYGGTGLILTGSNEIVIFVYAGDIYTGVTITPEVWNNIVFTHSSGTNKVYVNGSLVDTRSQDFTFYNSRLGILSDPNNGGNGMNGGFDEMIIEDKTRTDQEVLDYYNQTKGNYEPQPRTPGANTLAWYPFSSDYVDASGNSPTATAQNTTIGTYNGVDCLNLNSSYAYVSGIDITNVSGYTVSAWIYITGGLAIQFTESGGRGGSGPYIFTSGQGYLRRGNGTDLESRIGELATGWHHIVQTGDIGGEGIWTVDGVADVKIASGLSAPSANGTQLNIGAEFNSTTRAGGYVSNLIIEDKARTAQEISDYYNQTKGDYGIS